MITEPVSPMSRSDLIMKAFIDGTAVPTPQNRYEDLLIQALSAGGGGSSEVIERLREQIAGLEGEVASLSSQLSTLEEEKAELESEISTLTQTTTAGKEIIANAVTTKGVPTTSTDSYEVIAENILSIHTSSGGWYSPSLIANSYVNENNGSFVSYAGWSRTDYISIKNGQIKLSIANFAAGSDIYNAYYDADKKYIGRMTLSVDGIHTITPPDNAAYFALSNETNRITNTLIYDAIGIETMEGT